MAIPTRLGYKKVRHAWSTLPPAVVRPPCGYGSSGGRHARIANDEIITWQAGRSIPQSEDLEWLGTATVAASSDPILPLISANVTRRTFLNKGCACGALILAGSSRGISETTESKPPKEDLTHPVNPPQVMAVLTDIDRTGGRDPFDSPKEIP
jgi:hypothetical protein